MKACLIPFVIATLSKSVLAYPSAAGSCAEGPDAVGGPHFTRSSTVFGELSQAGFIVTLGSGTVLSPFVSGTFPVNVPTTITISGSKTFRGFLLRLGETDAPTDTAFSIGTSSDIQLSTLCTSVEQVGGVTHTSNADKSTVSATLNLPTAAANMPLDVTIVVENSEAISEYYYSRFTISTADAGPTVGTAAPATLAPSPSAPATTVPSLAAPVVGTDSPASSSAPVNIGTDSPESSPVTVSLPPVASPVDTPVSPPPVVAPVVPPPVIAPVSPAPVVAPVVPPPVVAPVSPAPVVAPVVPPPVVAPVSPAPVVAPVVPPPVVAPVSPPPVVAPVVPPPVVAPVVPPPVVAPVVPPPVVAPVVPPPVVAPVVPPPVVAPVVPPPVISSTIPSAVPYAAPILSLAPSRRTGSVKGKGSTSKSGKTSKAGMKMGSNSTKNMEGKGISHKGMEGKGISHKGMKGKGSSHKGMKGKGGSHKGMKGKGGSRKRMGGIGEGGYGNNSTVIFGKGGNEPYDSESTLASRSSEVSERIRKRNSGNPGRFQ